MAFEPPENRIHWFCEFGNIQYTINITEVKIRSIPLHFYLHNDLDQNQLLLKQMRQNYTF